MKDKSGIYEILCIKNNKRYIGSTNSIVKRWSAHKKALEKNKHWNIHLQRAYNKFGKNNFQFILLKETNEKDLLHIEQQYINIYEAKKLLFNINKEPSGGRRGTKLTQEQKNKLSILNSGSGNPFYGKKHSNKTKEILSKKHRGKILTNEHKQAISNSLKKRNVNIVKFKSSKISYQNAQEIRRLKKETNLKSKEIAEKFGISPQSVCSILKNRQWKIRGLHDNGEE